MYMYLPICVHLVKVLFTIKLVIIPIHVLGLNFDQIQHPFTEQQNKENRTINNFDSYYIHLHKISAIEKSNIVTKSDLQPAL